VFRSRRLGCCSFSLLVGVAAPLTGQTLQAWLTSEHVVARSDRRIQPRRLAYTFKSCGRRCSIDSALPFLGRGAAG